MCKKCYLNFTFYVRQSLIIKIYAENTEMTTPLYELPYYEALSHSVKWSTYSWRLIYTLHKTPK